jgi:beta-glucanase (GH16 family)
LEYYTNNTNNAYVSNGNLVIEAKSEVINGFNYSSTRMITKGKKSFKYGRVDIRAKLPKGKGIWPALWMLGENIDAVGWPACGEIDMMELLGHEPNKVYGTLHWGANPTEHQSYGTNKVLSSGNFADTFHVFTMKWSQNSVELLIDDVSYFIMDTTSGSFPFNANFFFIFNVAVGGDWPGSPDSSTQFPQRMVVDYIRVFQ